VFDNPYLKVNLGARYENEDENCTRANGGGERVKTARCENCMYQSMMHAAPSALMDYRFFYIFYISCYVPLVFLNISHLIMLNDHSSHVHSPKALL
jgi:hypothetical protein